MIYISFHSIAHSFIYSLWNVSWNQIQPLSFCVSWITPQEDHHLCKLLGMSLAVSSTTQLRDRHDERVFKAAARTWLPWLLAYSPSWCPYFFRERNWPFSLSTATLYVWLKDPVSQSVWWQVNWFLSSESLQRVTFMYLCISLSLKKEAAGAAPVHPMQKCTGLSRAWTSHLPFGSWLTSRRQQLALWLLVFSQADYKCILIVTQTIPANALEFTSLISRLFMHLTFFLGNLWNWLGHQDEKWSMWHVGSYFPLASLTDISTIFPLRPDEAQSSHPWIQWSLLFGAGQKSTAQHAVEGNVFGTGTHQIWVSTL